MEQGVWTQRRHWLRSMSLKRIKKSFNVVNISNHSDHDSDYHVRETDDLHMIAVPTTVRACRAQTHHLVSPVSLVDVIVHRRAALCRSKKRCCRLVGQVLMRKSLSNASSEGKQPVKD